jgi:hypothetical protein
MFLTRLILFILFVVLFYLVLANINSPETGPVSGAVSVPVSFDQRRDAKQRAVCSRSTNKMEENLFQEIY